MIHFIYFLNNGYLFNKLKDKIQFNNPLQTSQLSYSNFFYRANILPSILNLQCLTRDMEINMFFIYKKYNSSKYAYEIFN